MIPTWLVNWAAKVSPAPIKYDHMMKTGARQLLKQIKLAVSWKQIVWLLLQ